MTTVPPIMGLCVTKDRPPARSSPHWWRHFGHSSRRVKHDDNKSHGPSERVLRRAKGGTTIVGTCSVQYVCSTECAHHRVALCNCATGRNAAALSGWAWRRQASQQGARIPASHAWARRTILQMGRKTSRTAASRGTQSRSTAESQTSWARVVLSYE